MILSPHLLAVKTREKFLLLNGLNGFLALMEKKDWETIKKTIKNNSQSPGQAADLLKVLLSKKFLFSNPKQARRYQQAVFHTAEKLILLENRRLTLTVNFSENCNLACPYCFNLSRHGGQLMSQNHLDQIFSLIGFFQKKQKRIVDQVIYLYGGEPLMTENFSLVAYFLKKLKAAKKSVFIFTNGITIKQYLPLFRRYSSLIQAFQITLDGPPQIHNQRRTGPRYPQTFNLITQSIDLLLKNGFTVRLRTNLDEENFSSLPDLARLIISKGWPSYSFFSAYLSLVKNNQAKKTAQNPFANPSKFIKKFDRLLAKHPEMRLYPKDSFFDNYHYFFLNILKHRPNQPYSFYRPVCYPRSLTFAADGEIYACHIAVGLRCFSIGKYYPKPSWNKKNIDLWEKRTPAHLKKCQSCPLVLICAGNCPLAAYEHNGDINMPYCHQAIRNLKEFVKLNEDQALTLTNRSSTQPKQLA